MQVLFTLSELFLVVTEKRIINEYSMLHELFVVWHAISFKHYQLLRKSSREIRSELGKQFNCILIRLRRRVINKIAAASNLFSALNPSVPFIF